MKQAILVLIVMSTIANAQIRPDTAVSIDESFNEQEFESLVEQSTDDENSALLDLLDTSAVEKNLLLRSRFIQRIQQSKGFENQNYLGTPLRAYQRMKFTAGSQYSAGVLIEKDPGEQRMNDFASGYFAVRSLGPITALVVGDFLLEAGQGVTFWRGYDIQKGANVVAPAHRKARGVIPYSSSDENYFLRGGAVNLSFEPLSVAVFYSDRTLSASVDTSIDGGVVKSFYTNGYFRTESEIAKRNQVEERLLGGRIEYQISERNAIGLNGYTTKFSRQIVLHDGKRFANDRLSLISGEYRFHLSALDFFGEWARGDNRSTGGISGIQMTPSSSISLITAYRNYPYDFVSFHANAFGERTGTYNEKGYYAGVKVRPLKGAQLSTYYDQFEFPMPSSTSKFSSGGHELFLQADAAVAPRLELSVRYRRKITDQRETVTEGTTSKHIDDQLTKYGIRLHTDYQVSKNVKLRGRFEFVDITTRYTRQHETGFLMYQDVRLQQSERWSLNFRIVFFRTDSYDAGIAEYENDLPGVLSVPILSGKGAKWYALVKYSVFETLDLSLKYSDLIRDDVKRIGSGLDELPTNHDNRIGVQLDFRI
jgi:hypothetical protein